MANEFMRLNRGVICRIEKGPQTLALAEQALPQLELHWFPFVQRGIDVRTKATSSARALATASSIRSRLSLSGEATRPNRDATHSSS
jgi:hypothetical protein